MVWPSFLSIFFQKIVPCNQSPEVCFLYAPQLIQMCTYRLIKPFVFTVFGCLSILVGLPEQQQTQSAQARVPGLPITCVWGAQAPFSSFSSNFMNTKSGPHLITKSETVIAGGSGRSSPDFLPSHPVLLIRSMLPSQNSKILTLLFHIFPNKTKKQIAAKMQHASFEYGDTKKLMFLIS